MKIFSIEDTYKLSKDISQKIKKGDVIFLYGEIGTGKTTFSRFLINSLETQEGIKKSDILSPTFNIVYEYKIGKLKLLHYDLYRIKNFRDLEQLGMLEDYASCITLVEWPELIKKKNKDRIEIYIKYSKNLKKRIINIKTFGRCNDYKLKKH